jgi:hypothetical protein
MNTIRNLLLAAIATASLGFGVASAQEATSQFLAPSAYWNAPSVGKAQSGTSVRETYIVRTGRYDIGTVSGSDGSAGR